MAGIQNMHALPECTRARAFFTCASGPIRAMCIQIKDFTIRHKTKSHAFAVAVVRRLGEKTYAGNDFPRSLSPRQSLLLPAAAAAAKQQQ